MKAKQIKALNNWKKFLATQNVGVAELYQKLVDSALLFLASLAYYSTWGSDDDILN